MQHGNDDDSLLVDLTCKSNEVERRESTRNGKDTSLADYGIFMPIAEKFLESSLFNGQHPTIGRHDAWVNLHQCSHPAGGWGRGEF